MKPYYSRAGITLYHGDCREVLPGLSGESFSAIVTDPPYGIAHKTNFDSSWKGNTIAGDEDTSSRDWVLEWGKNLPAIVFGLWTRPRPSNVKAILIWDKGPQSAAGDCSFPWKPSWEEIYVIGKGFKGFRDEGVIKNRTMVSWESLGRTHQHEKPVNLMTHLISKCPPGQIIDPFSGSGSTLVASFRWQRPAVGVEINEAYCEGIAKRLDRELAQGDLFVLREEMR